jgi:hypothetical protein
MKKIYSLVIGLLFVTMITPIFSNAQTGASETIQANARVLKQITLTSTDIQFGAVPAGNIAILSPTSIGSSNVGFNSFCGTLVIDASHDEPIRVEFPSWVRMSGTNTTNPVSDSITYIPSVTVATGNASLNSTEQQNSILLAKTSPSPSPVAGTDAGGNGTGGFGIVYTNATIGVGYEKVTLFFGGSLYESNGNGNAPIPSSQPTGTYTATLLINVLYGI